MPSGQRRPDVDLAADVSGFSRQPEMSQCVVANRILFERQRVMVWTEVRVRSRA